MENKELPSITEYLSKHHIKPKIILNTGGDGFDLSRLMEEYAQLVAEYHVKEERKKNDIVLKELKENLFQIRNLINS